MQNAKFVPFKGVFLNDSRDLNEQDKQIKFLDKLSLNQEKLFHFSNFIGQALAVSRAFVSLDYFAQTRCLRIIFLLITFLGQPVPTLGELVPHDRFPQTNAIIRFAFINTQSNNMQDDYWIMVANVFLMKCSLTTILKFEGTAFSLNPRIKWCWLFCSPFPVIPVFTRLRQLFISSFSVKK